MVKRHLTAWAVLCLLTLLLPGPGKGQSTNATIIGTVTDPTGAAIQGPVNTHVRGHRDSRENRLGTRRPLLLSESTVWDLRTTGLCPGIQGLRPGRHRADLERRGAPRRET